jgi:hypothetical protein
MARLSRLLGDGPLGFLAILGACTSLAPIIFSVSESLHQAFTVFEWIATALFGAAYAVQLYLAPDKRHTAFSFWGIVSLLSFALPLITLVPGVSDVLRTSLGLRLIRLIRIAATGARAGHVVARPRAAPSGPMRPPKIRVMTPSLHARDRDTLPLKTSEAWVHVTSPSREQIQSLSAAYAIPAALLDVHARSLQHPRLESSTKATVFSAENVLFVLTRDSLYTLSRDEVSIQEQAVEHADRSGEFAPRMIAACFKLLTEHYRKRADHLHHRFNELEGIPLRQGGTEFFENLFGSTRRWRHARQTCGG